MEKDIFKDCIKHELDEKDIDITREDYNQNSAFKQMEQEYVMDNGILITKAWWVEKYLVDQKLLEKIYGIYAFGIRHDFSESELKDYALFL